VIQNGSKVKIHYILKVNGDVVQSTAGTEPLCYVQGSGQILPGLEKELEGLNEGDKKQVTLPPDKGYGQRDPEALRQVPRNAFKDSESIRVGLKVAGESERGRFEAFVTDVKPEVVTLDMNHPLAGRTLEYSLQVVEVQ
jgi:FKBP-type peptidyl-prolyl cis-trans isomerase SlyD